LFVLIAFFGCESKKSVDVEEAYKKGLKELSDGEFESAVASFTSVIAADPEMAKAYQKRIEAFRAIDANNEAMLDLNRYIELSPDEVWGYRERAILKQIIGKDAVDDYMKIIELEPTKATRAFAHIGLANHYVKNNQLQKAAEHYTIAIKYDDDNPFPYVARGNIHQSMGDLEAARKDFDRSLDLRENSVFSLSSRGYTSMISGEFETAMNDFDRAIELYGEDSERVGRIYGLRAQTKLNTGDIEGAKADMQRYVELDPGMHANIEIARLYEHLGETDKASELFEKVVNEEASNLPEILIKAVAKKSLGDLEGAIALADSVAKNAELDPLKVSALVQLQAMRCEAEDFEGALKDCNTAIEIMPDLASLYAARSYVKAQMGNLELAKADALYAVQKSGGRFGYYNLACFEALLDDTENAFKHLRKALEIGEISKEYVAQDPDWDSCRDMSEYKKIMAES
jgi:tetratricopeptide (TPR) repeat protein